VRSRILPAMILFAAGAAAFAQTPPPRPGPPLTPTSPPPQFPPQPATPPPLAPPAQSLEHLPLEQLIAVLEGLAEQKAELARQEAARARNEADVVAEVRKRVAKHSQTLQKLGHAPLAPGSTSLPRPTSEPVPPSDLVPANTTGRRRSPVPLTVPAPAAPYIEGVPAAPQPAPLPPLGPSS
jgi:hypothetical protein